MRSADRLIGHISKYEPVSGYMLTVLHWLPSEQRITYRLSALILRCLLGLTGPVSYTGRRAGLVCLLVSTDPGSIPAAGES